MLSPRGRPSGFALPDRRYINFARRCPTGRTGDQPAATSSNTSGLDQGSLPPPVGSDRREGLMRVSYYRYLIFQSSS